MDSTANAWRAGCLELEPDFDDVEGSDDEAGCETCDAACYGGDGGTRCAALGAWVVSCHGVGIMFTVVNRWGGGWDILCQKSNFNIIGI